MERRPAARGDQGRGEQGMKRNEGPTIAQLADWWLESGNELPSAMANAATGGEGDLEGAIASWEMIVETPATGRGRGWIGSTARGIQDRAGEREEVELPRPDREQRRAMLKEMRQ